VKNFRSLLFGALLLAVLPAKTALNAADAAETANETGYNANETDYTANETGFNAEHDRYTVKLAVIGPGDELYFWWGHLGLIIEDNSTGESDFYDWGVFSFEAADFFKNFAFGRLVYLTTVTPTDRVLRHYKRLNRDITLYTLNLDEERKKSIKDFVDWNVKPENRSYLYNHFSNNCVTRILVLLDEATDGQIRAKYENTPGRFSIRGHVRRHTWFSPAADWILNFWMGQGIDGPDTMWDEMFLPSETGRNLSTFVYTDASGRERRLVSGVEAVNTAQGRHAVLDTPPNAALRAVPYGLGLAAMSAFLVFARRQAAKKKALRAQRVFRVLLGVFHAICGLIFGAAGSILFFLTFFTNHDYAWHNANVLFVNPLFLLLIPLGLVFAAAKSLKKRLITSTLIHALWTYVFLGGLLTVLIKLSPLYYQQNQVTQILLLPCALILAIPFREQRYAA